MKEEKHSSEPASYRESQSFKQSYAGTFANPIGEKSKSIKSDREGNDTERKILPMECEVFINKCADWIGKHHDVVTAMSTALIFIATAVYAVFAIFLWIAANTSAKAARQAAETARRQLEMTDRPWIKDTVVPSYDFVGQDNVFSFEVTIRAENIGHSVATGILPEAKLIVIQDADFIEAPLTCPPLSIT